MIGTFFQGLASWVMNFITGGGLDAILKTIDSAMDEGVRKEEVKADVTKKWIDAQANLLVGRTWWFQLFFVIPLGLWWTAVILDSIFPGQWNIAQLPSPLDDWAGWIITALFLVDGSKAVMGRLKK